MSPSTIAPCDDRTPDSDEIERLRGQHYNATLIERLDVHADLARFRVRPDAGIPFFSPGQYVALGLGYWERRLPGTQLESLAPKQIKKVVRRAYSISCPMLDSQGNLLPCDQCDYLEFYITLIRQANEPPGLTPRLFQLAVGDRLQVHTRIVGTYTLAAIDPEDTVVMLGTGTGEAPHNAMVAGLLSAGHRGPIVNVTCVRHYADLGYLREQQQLMSRFSNYRYLSMTTREIERPLQGAAGYLGNARLQTVYRNGQLGSAAGIDFNPLRTHVFLCGNPQMIGLERPGGPQLTEPGMLQLLQADGFHPLHAMHTDSTPHVSHPAGPGAVRFEKYW